MSVTFQLVIDCANPDRLARFWAAALGYELAPPPAGFATWTDYYRDLGLPEEDLAEGADRISDPEGHGPSIWFHQVAETKIVKNRLHLDLRASGERLPRDGPAPSRPDLSRLSRPDHPRAGLESGPRRRHERTGWEFGWATTRASRSRTT